MSGSEPDTTVVGEPEEVLSFCSKENRLRPAAVPLCQMKIALVYILLIATLLPTVSQWGTIAYYHANRDYIARVLCENRDKPQMHCDGKCYLAKKLKAQQDRQAKDMTARLQNLPIITLFCSDISTFLLVQQTIRLLAHKLPVYLLSDYRAPLNSLFQPPRL